MGDSLFCLKLLRFHSTPTETIGLLYGEDVPSFYTLELPYRDNQKNVSCIPPGRYSLIKHMSYKFGPCFEIANVPNRSGILLHAANLVDELRGCTAVGHGYRMTDKGVFLYKSRSAIETLNATLKGKGKPLAIEIDYAHTDRPPA